MMMMMPQHQYLQMSMSMSPPDDDARCCCSRDDARNAVNGTSVSVTTLLVAAYWRDEQYYGSSRMSSDSDGDSDSATMMEFIVTFTLCSPTDIARYTYLASRHFRRIFYRHIIAIHFFPPLFSLLLLPAIFISTVDHRNRQAASIVGSLTLARTSRHGGHSTIIILLSPASHQLSGSIIRNCSTCISTSTFHFH